MADYALLPSKSLSGFDSGACKSVRSCGKAPAGRQQYNTYANLGAASDIRNRDKNGSARLDACST